MIKNFIRELIHRQRLQKQRELPRLLSSITGGDKLHCVDVGAAVGLIEQWEDIGTSGEHYLIEPCPESAQQLRHQYANRNNYHVIEEGLSEHGGNRTLHVTNCPTGSSILKFNTDLIGNYIDPDYVHPMKAIEIGTTTLANLVESQALPQIDLLKIDVQGAEFEIIKSLGEDHLKKLNCLEFEFNLHNAYLGQGSFTEIQDFLASYDLQLYDIRVARTFGLLNSKPVDASYFGVFANSRSVSSRVWELDLVFFRSADSLVKKKDPQALRRLLASFAVYGFYLDIIRVCQTPEVKTLLGQSIVDEIIRSVIDVQKLTSLRWYDRPTMISKLVRRIGNMFGNGPDRYRLQYSHVALPNS